jgi:glycosyltransferase involved in cell wall biosynthesis
VIISGLDDHRIQWSRFQVSTPNVSVIRAWGISLTEWGSDERSIHINPGYAVHLLRSRPEAVITSEIGFRTAIALLYGFWTGRPIWVWWGGTKHTESHVGPFRRGLRAIAAKVVKRWISYGASSTEYLVSLGIPEARILQIQNCVPEDAYRPKPRTVNVYSDKPVILCVSQLIRRKGIELLLMAARTLQAEGYRFSLVIAGEGPLRSSLEKQVENLALSNVHFLGAVDPASMPSVYAAADCLVFPTLSDVWGLVINEAILSGVPVLCSVYAGCASEIVPKEHLFDPLNGEEFIQTLRKAVEGRLRPISTEALTSPTDSGDTIAHHILKGISR